MVMYKAENLQQWKKNKEREKDKEKEKNEYKEKERRLKNETLTFTIFLDSITILFILFRLTSCYAITHHCLVRAYSMKKKWIVRYHGKIYGQLKKWCR